MHSLAADGYTHGRIHSRGSFMLRDSLSIPELIPDLLNYDAGLADRFAPSRRRIQESMATTCVIQPIALSRLVDPGLDAIDEARPKVTDSGITNRRPGHFRNSPRNLCPDSKCLRRQTRRIPSAAPPISGPLSVESRYCKR